jgi:hypothetical protein
MKFKRWSVIVALIAIIATVVGVSLESAWAQGEPEIQATGNVGDVQLLAKGVGVSVPYQISCSGTNQVTYFQMYVQIRERLPKAGTVFGAQYTDIFETGPTALTCTGQLQTVDVETIVPESSGLFKKGSALANVSITVCGIVDTSGDYPTTDCDNIEFGQEVRIR